MSQVLQSIRGANFSGLTTDLSEAIGVTTGIMAGAYVVYKTQNQSTGAFIGLIIGAVIMLIFPEPGLLNGIGVGLLGYSLYQLIKMASNGAII